MSRRWYRNSSLIVVLFAAIAAADLWLAWTWSSSIADADAAESQLQECQTLATQIENLRAAPVVVEEEARTTASFNRRCESAAATTGLKTDAIVEIVPSVPRRVDDTSYQEQVTSVELRRVTLKQLVEVALAIRRLDAGLHVSSLALRVPPGEDKANGVNEMWNVQLALTTYIYAPKLPASP